MKKPKLNKEKLKAAPDNLSFWVITIGCLLLISFGIFLMLKVNQTIPPAITIPISNAAPVAKRLSSDDINNYKVAADLPRFIIIPAIKVPKTRVKHLGVGKNGQIAVPDNIYDAGWYTGSAKPGQTGAMFIFGHISNWTANGIFHDLKNLKTGDQVTIERGDGKKFTYQVQRSKTYPADNVNMGEVLAPSNPNIPALNLMTCGGKVKKGTNDFTERLVVFTNLVQ